MSISVDCKFINIYVYSDSLAFRRVGQPHDISFTYPFLLMRLIEDRLGVKVNLLLRGGGGADVRMIKNVVEGDTGYFGGDERVINIAILQVGIVDCAPRPFTYLLAPVLRRVPVIGPRILSALVRHRAWVQGLWSYVATSKFRFRKEYASIVKMLYASKIRPIAVGLPLPSLAVEKRSPGFRRSVGIYNAIISSAHPEGFCNVEQEMNESLRNSLLLPDGHHLTEDGHRLYSELLFCRVKKLL